MLLHGTTAAAKPGEPLERALVTAAGAISAMLVTLCGLVLGLRRMGGGFEPTGGAGLVLVAALGGLLVLATDAAARVASLGLVWRTTARTGYLLALAALSVPPRNLAGLDGMCFVAGMGLAGAVVAGPFVGARAGRWLADIRARGSRPRVSRPQPPPAPAPPAPRAASDVPSTVCCPGHLRQRFERYELEGLDCLRGTLTLNVPQGARSAHGHVGFCPSFRQVPSLETSTSYDGVEAVVTAAEIVPWGVRIECRLDEPAEEPVEIPVDIVARAPA